MESDLFIGKLVFYDAGDCGKPWWIPGIVYAKHVNDLGKWRGEYRIEWYIESALQRASGGVTFWEKTLLTKGYYSRWGEKLKIDLR